MRVLEQSLLDVKSGIIAHQTNCYGAMGAGVAKAIKDMYPRVYQGYAYWCSRVAPQNLLGTVQLEKATHSLYVANIFSQLDHKAGKKQTNYYALGAALHALGDEIIGLRIPYREIHVPYLMGCGLGGGDWDVYGQILEDWEAASPFEIVVCRLPQS